MKKENKTSREGRGENGSKTVISLLLALAIPGAGHLYLRKYWQAAVFFISVLSLAAVGVLIGGEMHSFLRANSGEGFLQFMAAIGNIGLGVFHLIFHFAGWALGDITLRSYEYGTTFIVVAALLNVLIILDAYDYARGEKK